MGAFAVGCESFGLGAPVRSGAVVYYVVGAERFELVGLFLRAGGGDYGSACREGELGLVSSASARRSKIVIAMAPYL